MNKKIIVIFIVGLFFFSGTGGYLTAEISQHNNEQTYQTLDKKVTFTTPEILNEGSYKTIHVKEADQQKITIGKPLMPAKTTVYTFPINYKIHDVIATPSQSTYIPLKQQLEPSPVPLPYSVDYLKESEMIQSLVKQQDNIQKFTGFYPSSWYDYSIKIGLDEQNKQSIFVIVNTYPVKYSMEKEMIEYVTDIDIEIQYSQQNHVNAFDTTYDFLIVAGSAYLDELEPFVTFKEDRGISTKLVSFADITTDGYDDAEKLKYFIKQSIEEWNVKSVLLVGGYRSFFGFNKPELQIPNRYVYLDDTGEPGYISDNYYADIYAYDPETDSMVFSSWDTDKDGKYGEWYYISNDQQDKQDEVDLMPDVHLGRWACRTEQEAAIMVAKTIRYEQHDYTTEDWFNRMIAVTGDDFQDQTMLDIPWDTTGLQGTFTIHAQSENHYGEVGPEDTVIVEVDHSKESIVGFSEDDHLITNLQYPHPPVAEITVPAEGDIIGSTDVYEENPPGAYIGYRWTPVNYSDKILNIRGKSYNPQPHIETGVNTTLTVWITDEDENIIFGPVSRNLSMYFEGEWATQKAMDFMPDDMEKIKLWTSMGTFKGSEEDVHDGIASIVDQLSQGSGFLYIAGHANPMIYANHYPGIPGGRANGDVKGLTQFQPFAGFNPKDIFPLTELDNGEKQPILVLSGCHPCQLDVSFLRLLQEGKYALWYGTFVWESLGWWLTRLENGGAIATLGPTGLGYGGVGHWGTKGLGGWLWPELFRQYNQEGKHVLGEAWTQSLNNYIIEFGPNLDLIDTKTVEEMVLLGDPTLMIG